MSDSRGAAVELSEAQLLALYEWMLTGRILESLLLEAGEAGRGGFLYPGSGQEAAQVGFASALDPGDVFAGGHRDLLATLVRGVTLEEALLDVFGKAAGPSRGRRALGTPAPARGVLGVSGATADGMAVAVGAALAFAGRAESRVVLACCGEGTAATGAWHEAVNTAAVLGLPVVFAVENNQYAYSLPNESVSRLAYTAHRADGYGIPGIVVDGNDVLEVYSAAREAVERARSGEGPSLVEAVTFRHEGHHVGDPAAYVDPESRESWLARDPLPRFEEYLGSRGVLDETRRAHLEQRVRSRVTRSLEWARLQPDPEPAPPAPVLTFPRADTPAPPPAAAEATMGEALARALDEEMGRDEAVIALGTDIGRLGGRYGITRGLRERYGPRRVVDFPAAGPGLVGAAVGAAWSGLRPVAEVPIGHLSASLELLAGHAVGAEPPISVVLRVPYGPDRLCGWDPEGASTLPLPPGLTVVVPATAVAAKGLLSAAVRHPGPVIFLEPVALYGAAGPLPPGEYQTALGEARTARPGDDVSVMAWGAAVPAALEAAEQAAAVGVSVEVLDLQTLAPLDWEPLLASVSRTGRLVVVEDCPGPGGMGARVVAGVAEEAFWHLDAPVRRVRPAPSLAFTVEGARRLASADILAAVLSLAHT